MLKRNSTVKSIGGKKPIASTCVLIGLVLSNLVSCSQKMDHSSRLSQTPTGSFQKCDDGKLFGPAYQACLIEQQFETMSNTIQSEANSTRAELASSVPALTGLVYSFQSKKHETCLSESNGKWMWQPCTRYGLNQQFHIGDRQKIRYWLKRDQNNGDQPITLDGYAFRLETKSSIDRWLASERCSDQGNEQDALEGVAQEKDCIAAIDDQDYDNQRAAIPQCLSVITTGERAGELQTSECSDATFFVALPSKYGLNQALDSASAIDLRFNQEDRRYVSLLAIADREINRRIDTIEGTLSTEPSPEEENCSLLWETASSVGISEEDFEGLYPECSVLEKPQLVDLSDAFQDQSNCQYFRHLVSGNPGEPLTAICPTGKPSLGDDQSSIEDTHLMLSSCSIGLYGQDAECPRSEAIKKLDDHFEELDQGLVVQLMPADNPGKCARLSEDRLRISFIDCAEGKNDDVRTQFRSITMALKAEASSENEPATPTGAILIKLQSIEDPKWCIDAEKLIGIPCDTVGVGPGIGAYELTPSNNGVLSTIQRQPYTLHHCSIVSSHTENKAYDCRYNVPSKLKRWAELGFKLSFLGLVGIPFWIVDAPVATIALSSLIASIPSFVFDGLVCGSREPNVALGSCISLGIGLGLELTINLIGVPLKATAKKLLSAAFVRPSFQDFIKSWRYYSAFDNVIAIGEVSGINSAVKRSWAYIAKKLYRTGQFVPETGANLIESSFINSVKRNKFDHKQIKDLLEKLWNSGKGACGRIACRHPLSALPSPKEIDQFISKRLVKATLPKMSNLTAIEKQNIRILLSPESTESAIELARQGL